MKISKKIPRRILCIIIVIIIVGSILILPGVAVFQPSQVEDFTEPYEPSATTEPHVSSLITEPTLFNNLFCYEFESIEQVNTFISDVDDAVEFLTNECSTVGKYTYDAIVKMIAEIDRLTCEQTYATRQKEQFLLWEKKEREYYYATRTWKFLRGLGYSDVACAGIMGNLMAECGGHTLALDPFLYDKATGRYYGMFQWSMYYYPAVAGASFEEQLAYYEQTSHEIFRVFGKNYKEGFTLLEFNELTDVRETALAFAQVYERCSSLYFERRQNFAEIAYQYFVEDFQEIFL
jgi:hypothetical protein